MPRRREVPKRERLPDPKYQSELLSRFICVVMRDGKKSTAEGIVYGALDKAADVLSVPALEVFDTALSNIKPVLEVRSRRVGGATYQVPGEVRPSRRMSLAMRWLVDFARGRRAERGMVNKLAAELIDAYRGDGNAIKKREDTHRMAEANKAFAHYRW